jgi:hypothetical protein
MSRVKKYLLVVAALLIIMYFVNPPTDKKKIEPSTTNRFIEKSSTVKEKTEPSTTNRVVEERNEAIGEPIFEIRLGETIEELQKRYSISSIPANQDKGQINKLYIIENKIPEVKDLRVQCFKGKIYEIDVFLVDTKRTNFDFVVETIRNKYNILKETKTKDESYKLGIYTGSILEYEFLVNFNGEDVVISPVLDITSSRIADALVVSYTYVKIDTLVKDEYKKMYSEEKEEKRKNEEASKKRLGDGL